jgi:hypothetical protein
MSEFVDALSPFIYGFAVGYFWYPLWQLGKKIVSEARKAKEQW